MLEHPKKKVENELITEILEGKKVDNKRPHLFELVANRKGKVMDFKGNYLFDGLKEQNINIIHPLVLSAYNG